MSKIIVIDNRLKSGCPTNCGECHKCIASCFYNSHYHAEVQRFREDLEDERDPEPWWSCRYDCGECGWCKRGVDPELG